MHNPGVWQRPAYPAVYTTPVYAETPTYTAPTYTAPTYTAAPTYVAPAQPTYVAPAPTYTAPTYAPPAPTYAAPAQPASCGCITKSYMPDGSVMFTDACTKETFMAQPAAAPQPAGYGN